MADLGSLLAQPWLVATLLLSVRIAAMLLLTPVLYALELPPLVRILVVLGLSAVIAAPLAGGQEAVFAARGVLLHAVLREAAVGATLGLGILLAFAGFSFAGRILDVQVGYGIGQVFDPLTRAHVPVLSSTFGVLSAVLFFAVNGHHALLRGVAYSVERFPLGGGASIADAMHPIAREAAGLFALGFALAAPVVMALFLVDLALAVVSRNVPQMNMLVMGIPVKIVAGLLALSIWAAALGSPSARLYAQIHATWAAWFAAESRR